MAAHKKLKDHGYNDVCSYGTGNRVNLPGPTPYQPNVFEFGQTPYKTMYDQLKASDEALYLRNGVLQMLERNYRVKSVPERWQDDKMRRFDVAITYEERVYDALVDDMESRGASNYHALHVVGLDVRDNHKEAEKGANDSLMLVEMMRDAGEDWEDKLDGILEVFQKKTGREITHTICFY